MTKKTIKIPDNFFLGAGSSAWQTEGWSGKKENQDSYLDLWYKENKHVWHNGYGPAGATDFYNRSHEDIELMKEIGLQSYRTSINWSRFLTDYEEVIVDEDYANHIDRLINSLLENGIEPMLCLEHYEVPAFLFKKYDGWGSRNVVDLFVKYAEKVFERFGDRVKTWFTFNEPIVPQTRMYLDAIRYPFKQDTQRWMDWNYNKILANAKVVELYKQGNYDGKIGVILNPEVTYPRSSAEHDLKAAEMFDLFFNRIYLDPLIKGEFPSELIEILDQYGIDFTISYEDATLIKNHTVDIVGLNLYFPYRVKARTTAWNEEQPFHPARFYEMFELPGRKMNPHRGWEIFPKIMYDMAIRMKEDYGNIEWFIAENGMGVENEAQYKNNEGIIQDTYRIEFISEHLKWLVQATEDGANCIGYMPWAFTDNVSPMNAFKNRYGLVEIDLEENKKRRLKHSGYWYKEVIKTKEFQAEDESIFK